MSILKVDYMVAIFVQISYSLVPKIEVCLKYFLDKKYQKRSLRIASQKSQRPPAAAKGVTHLIGFNGIWQYAPQLKFHLGFEFQV